MRNSLVRSLVRGVTLAAGLCALPVASWASVDSTDVSSSPVDTVTQQDAGRLERREEKLLDSRQQGALRAALPRKRQAIIAGGSLLALGALIDYGLIMPAAADLRRDDLGGQLALLSPQMLAFGLRVAGPSIASMRTSEMADIWKRSVGTTAPRNWTWTIDFCGWGFYAASAVCGAVGMMDTSGAVNWGAWSLAMGITADIVWVGTVTYAWWYVTRIGTATHVPVSAQRKIIVAPWTGRSGTQGVTLVMRF